MTTRHMAWLSAVALATAGSMAACSKPTTPSAELSRDLDAASSAQSLTLAPTAGSQEVVSAVERAPVARRAPAPARVQFVTHRTPAAPSPAKVAQPVAPAVTPAAPVSTPATTVADVPAPATSTAAPARRPVPVPTAHQGRYKTEAEVFRDAPFPINP